MKARVLSAAVLAPLAVALVLLGNLPFLAGVVAMCGLATWEASALFGAQPTVALPKAWRVAGVAAASALLTGVYLDLSHPGAAHAVAALIVVGGLILLLAGGAPAQRLLHWAVLAGSLVYCAGLGAHFILLRAAAQGTGWTLLACAVTWGTDIGAFFSGRRFGRHPFFGAISPKKTLEGAIGGLAAGVVAALLAIALGGLHVPLPAGLLLGLTVSAAAQSGDLVESLLKREAGVKDSGTLIPGHGGILDRIDSLLFAVAVTYYWRLLFS